MLFAAWEAIARWDEDSRTALGDSGLGRTEALRLATVSGHLLTWDEHRRGPLAPGMDADLVVLDEDPVACALERMPGIGVRRTVVAGRTVHERDRDGVPPLP
jgi:predicted amidohydrolase YtcJ